MRGPGQPGPEPTQTLDGRREETMAKRKSRYAALLIIGIAFIPIAISLGVSFYGVAVTFMIIGAFRMRRERVLGGQTLHEEQGDG